jgi:hypothetical protein
MFCEWDNTDSTPSKQVKSVDDEIESVDEFDTLVCGVEKAGSGNGTQSADVITVGCFSVQACSFTFGIIKLPVFGAFVFGLHFFEFWLRDFWS